MIALCANENIPAATVRSLRDRGIQMASVWENSPGATDVQVMAMARAAHQVLITFDRDYGELVFGRGLPPPAGIVFFRFRPTSPTEPVDLIWPWLADGGARLLGSFVMLGRDASRIRSLPAVPQ